jgi:hypothetical protein
MTADAPLIQRLLPRHFKILELTLAGHDRKAIAQALEMSEPTITNVQRSPLFQAELVRRRREGEGATVATLDREAALGRARSLLEEASVGAAEKMVELMEAEDTSLQHRAAADILDRALGKSGQKESVPVVNITAEQVQLLNIALKESQNGQPQAPAAHSPPANPNADGQVDVHPAPAP